jgi:carnitine 3-dehydrogenase
MPWEPNLPPENVGTVAIIGAGTIGAGWAAHFLSRGHNVLVWDPDAGTQERVERIVRLAWPALIAMGLPEWARPDRFYVGQTLSEVIPRADFIQESAPERLELKRALLAEIDRESSPGVVIASSTSGFLPSEIALGARHPERILVGHPYNPAYLIPLVEVAASPATSEVAIRWVEKFYLLAGKKPLVLKRENPGFVANRLREALWREALHMIAHGEATVEEIDSATTNGPGVRWAVLGECMIAHLAGGPQGIAHLLDHFEEQWNSPWTRLAPPVLDEELRRALIEGCRSAAKTSSFDDMIVRRDKALVEILKIKNRLGI